MAEPTTHSGQPGDSAERDRHTERPSAAPIPPTGFTPAPDAPVPPAPRGSAADAPISSAPRGSDAGQPPVPGAPVAPGARDSDDAPRSAFETARAAIENIPGLGDINIREIDAIEPGPHRASPLSFIPTSLKIIPSFFAIFVVWAFQLPKILADPDGGPMFVLVSVLVLVGLLALTAVIALVSWRIHTWELEDDALVLRKKFITSSEKRIPYQRVHSIDLNAGLFTRLLGLVDVAVDTGTGVADKIDGLRRSDAEVLKRTVFARKELLSKVVAAGKVAAAQGAAPASRADGQGLTSVSDALAAAAAAGPATLTDDDGAHPGVPEGAEVSASPAGEVASEAGRTRVEDVSAPGRIDHETRLTRTQYVLSALTSPNINGLIVSLVGFVAGLFSLLDYAVDIFGEQIVYGLLGAGGEITADSAMGLLREAGPNLIGIAAGILLAVVLVVWVASAVLALIKWGNFVARRRDERIEVSWGLLSRNTRAVELSRVQYLSVDQSLIRRLTGYARLVAHTVGAQIDDAGSSGESGIVIHPFIKLSEVDAWLAEALPEFAGIVETAPGLDRLPGQALRRTLLHGLYWALSVAVIAGVPTVLRATGVIAVEGDVAWLVDACLVTLWALAAFVLVWGEFIRVLAWRLRRVGVAERHLVMVDGALGRRINAVPRTKLQALVARQSPFQRAARVATVKANTAIAAGNLTMRDASVDTSDGLLAWARPHYHNDQQVAQALADAGLA